MKTIVTLKSKDRDIFGVVIRQNTDGFFNLSDLQKAYDAESKIENWAVRRVDSVLYQEENWTRMYYALMEGKFINSSLLEFIELIKQKGITKALKSLGVYKTIGARETKSTWCNPVLFVLISLEMNPKIYGKTIYWITDELIKNRIDAGNLCKSLNKSIQKFNPDGSQYIQLAKALNYITFKNHFPGIRNEATKEQLKELSELENKMAFAIDMGYISCFDMLLNELRKIYNLKYKSIY
jgi:hypothetical protein